MGKFTGLAQLAYDKTVDIIAETGGDIDEVHDYFGNPDNLPDSVINAIMSAIGDYYADCDIKPE